MRFLPRVVLSSLSLFGATFGVAQSLLPAEAVPLDSLGAFRPVEGTWQVTGAVRDAWRHNRDTALTAGAGVIVGNPAAGTAGESLVTTWEHGDLDLEFDFLLSPDADGGVLLQGRYEVQLADSWGVKVPIFSDLGGIVDGAAPASRPGQQGFDGFAPAANASRAPGLWQRATVQFRAPRFDAQGKKIANARFLKVEINGYVVQENVEVAGATRGATFLDEQAVGPLVFEAARGPLAIRNLAVKRYGRATVGVSDLKLQYFTGPGRNLDNYYEGKPAREATLTHFAGAVLSSDDRGIARFTGAFEVPVAGDYEFRLDVLGQARLTIDNAVVVHPGVNSAQVGTVTLTAGKHDFVVEQQHSGSWALRDGGLKVWAEGPGIAPHSLAAVENKRTARREISIPIEPTDRILMQRTFVPLKQSRRLYACFVGTPLGVHYAYDLEQAAVIGVWRGGFFEGRDLWHERAEDQQAHATGPGFSIEAKPLLFQFGNHDPRWPTTPPATSATKGYRLEPNGQPVFLFEFSGVQVEDRVAPLADGTGLTRTLKFSGKPREKDMWALLAEGSRITLQPDGAGYVIGDREFYLDWPKDSTVKPALRREGDRTQLLVRITGSGPRELTYNLVW